MASESSTKGDTDDVAAMLIEELKHLQKDSRETVSKVSTSEQLAAWDKYKEQAQKQ